MARGRLWDRRVFSDICCLQGDQKLARKKWFGTVTVDGSEEELRKVLVDTH